MSVYVLDLEVILKLGNRPMPAVIVDSLAVWNSLPLLYVLLNGWSRLRLHTDLRTRAGVGVEGGDEGDKNESSECHL